MMRLLYVLLYSLPGGEQGSTMWTFSPAPPAVARGIIHFPASVSPSLPIGHPGPGKIHITNSFSARLQDPQNTRDRLEQAACSALHPSVLLSARRTAGEGGARRQVSGVHLFTLLPQFYPPCWPAAPSSLSALGTGSCPDRSRRMCQATSRRTHLPITVSTGYTGVLPWPLDPSPTKHS